MYAIKQAKDFLSTTIFEEANVTPQWQVATWQDYLRYADDSNPDITGLFFNEGYLFIQMGNEGIDHAAVNELFTMLFFLWFSIKQPEETFK